jgi:hypothetical protein
MKRTTVSSEAKKDDPCAKTYNSGDSPVVTHLTTSPPVRCLNRAERTGSLVFNVLWSYVEALSGSNEYDLRLSTFVDDLNKLCAVLHSQLHLLLF